MLNLSGRCSSVLAGLALLCLGGCGTAEGPKIVPVTGVVRIGGKPADNVLVRFVPDGKSLEGLIESSGVSNAEGAFELITSDQRKGAIPGPGRILVTDLLEERPAQGEVASSPPRFPAGYGVLNNNSLTATVTEGTPLAVEIPPQ